MEDQEGSVCSDQSGDSVCSDHSTASVNSYLAAVRARHLRPRPHRTNLCCVQSSPEQPIVSPESDVIGTLPDPVIQDILSCLPIDNAVRTSILARKWRPLWTQMPTLCFRHGCFSFDLEKFADIVDQTLEQFTGPKVQNFVISFKFTESMASSLDKWVLFATSHRVEKLCLVLEGGYANAPFIGTTPYRLPHFFYDNSYFKHLALRQCVVSYESYVSWRSLELLFISHSRVNDETIQNILSGSPKLQKLVLRNCDGISLFSSTSLKDLTIDGIYDPDEKEDCNTEIECPNLRSFSLLGFIHRRTYKVTDVSSSSSIVNLNFVMKIDEKDKSDSTRYQNIMKELLQKFCNVEKIIVGTWCLQVLSIRETKGLSSPLSLRKCLELKTEVREWELPGIMNLLKSSVYLKKLVIDLSPCRIVEPEFDEDFNAYAFDEVSFLGSTSWIRKSFLQSLEHIEITGFQPSCSRSNGLLVNLLELLVKKANLLKKVSIYEKKGRVHQSWKSSGPNENMGDAMRNQIVLMLSDSMPENAMMIE